MAFAVTSFALTLERLGTLINNLKVNAFLM